MVHPFVFNEFRDFFLLFLLFNIVVRRLQGLNLEERVSVRLGRFSRDLFEDSNKGNLSMGFFRLSISFGSSGKSHLAGSLVGVEGILLVQYLNPNCIFKSELSI